VILSLFIHFKEVRVEMLELGFHAQGYVVAQVDFEFPDKEATLILQQEAVQDIGSIYRIDETEIKKKRFEMEKFLIENRDWRTKIPKSTFEEMYKALDLVEDSLIQARLTDARTYQKMKEASFSIKNYQVVQSLTQKRGFVLPVTFWQHLEYSIVKEHQSNPQVISYILNFLKLDKWQLEEDFETQQGFRTLVEATIPEKYTQVKAGRRIIDQGELVTERHIDMMNAMKSALRESRNLFQLETFMGSLLFAVLLTFLGALYLKFNHRQIFDSFSKLSLYLVIIALTLFLAKGIEFGITQSGNRYLDMTRYPIIVPFAAILITILLHKNLALFTTTILTIVLGMTLAVDHGRFLFINLIASMSIILFSKSLRKRTEVFHACALAWLSCLPVILAFKLSELQLFEESFALDIISTFLFMLFTAILVVAILPILETTFAVLTDITLMEFMDPNNELLQRLSMEAPGTYQHSLVVGSLSEAAARSIGANGLFCRVSALYHDVGKLVNPQYFTENQRGGFDIHQLLTPYESAQVIISHVNEGVALAKKYGLPKSFIDIILEHHGTTLVYYFYCKQLEKLCGCLDKIDEKQFRYLGPKPHSKESAILMIADTVEAASRSLEDPSEENIIKLVDRIVADKAEDGQFDECQLTFEELGIVKKTLVKTLAITRHLRVKYPEKKQLS
jgi:putative nucleotidyltransferase with HDIG domain